MPDGEIFYNESGFTAGSAFLPNRVCKRKENAVLSKEEMFLMKPKVDFCFKELMEDTRRRMYMDKLEIHILELPKLEGYEYPRTELCLYKRGDLFPVDSEFFYFSGRSGGVSGKILAC